MLGLQEQLAQTAQIWKGKGKKDLIGNSQAEEQHELFVLPGLQGTQSPERHSENVYRMSNFKVILYVVFKRQLPKITKHKHKMQNKNDI